MNQPWTFEPFEADRDSVWTILDPNLGRVVAMFFDAEEAGRYLRWRNKKQAKRKEAQERGREIDYEGRC